MARNNQWKLQELQQFLQLFCSGYDLAFKRTRRDITHDFLKKAGEVMEDKYSIDTKTPVFDTADEREREIQSLTPAGRIVRPPDASDGRLGLGRGATFDKSNRHIHQRFYTTNVHRN